MSGKDNAPVIIKRKKVVAGGGHHGGAWKVAYADFVTAMMAFFLLMWLLNATTEKQRKGIADYFNPTIPVNRISGGGDGSFGGDSVFTEETLSQNGTGASNANSTDQKGAAAGEAEAERAHALEAKAFAEVQDLLTAFSGESMAADEAMRHIVTRVTDEGLIIELFDLEGEPLFAGRGSEPTEITGLLVGMLSEVFRIVRNDIAVSGHVSAQPIVVADNPVWDISTRRADRIRQLLETNGTPPKRILRVTGYADRRPAVGNPMSVRNNRVEIVLLRNQIRGK
ncbi:OmpA/MotB family protein [Celeribacter indicus]|uniref:Chemotaxis MotB protein n=1 Tax=Celeribacter indicus TaxID=1208324 RepID=A0A0B5DNQ3_9RHOB|nr:flagellar motor protein MotB [Celeribacter indicus]AJE44834.1 chemotaxis MotB protein [Celeribacter indicus]SDX23970.1 chemotaxis protein MotB [Celeribacter indicus]